MLCQLRSVTRAGKKHVNSFGRDICSILGLILLTYRCLFILIQWIFQSDHSLRRIQRTFHSFVIGRGVSAIYTLLVLTAISLTLPYRHTTVSFLPFDKVHTVMIVDHVVSTCRRNNEKSEISVDGGRLGRLCQNRL